MQHNVIQKVLILLQTRQYAQAEHILLNLTKANPKNALCWNLLGVAQKNLNKLVQSEEAFKRAIKLDPNNVGPGALNNLGNLYSLQNKTKQAIECYKQAVVKQSKFVDALYNLAKSYLDINQSQLAKKTLDRLLAIDSAHIGGLSCLALYFMRSNNNEKAEQLFDKVLLQDRANVVALQNKGILCKIRKDFKKAIDLLEKAASLNPRIAIIYQNLASCYASVGNVSEAEKLYRKAIELEPFNNEHHHWLSLLLWSDTRKEEFVDSYRNTLTLYPKAHELRKELVSKLILSAQNEQAIDELGILLKAEPRNTQYMKMLGTSYRNAGMFDKAIDLHKAAHDLNTKDLVLKEELATSFLAVGEACPALELLNECIMIQSSNQGLWALKSTALRLLNSDEYYYLNDYEKLVLIQEIDIPKGFSSIDEFNKALYETLKKYHVMKTEPLEQSLVSGTQTIDDLFTYDEPLLNELKKEFTRKEQEFFSKLKHDEKHPALSKICQPYVYSGAWSVMLRKSGYHRCHFHSKGWYSGPYYVLLPANASDDKREGWLKLGEPGFNAVAPLHADFEIKPRAGTVIRFPSYMWHGTYPYFSEEERLTVTCDLIPSLES